MKKLSQRLYGLTRESQNATDNLAYVVEENVLARFDEVFMTVLDLNMAFKPIDVVSVEPTFDQPPCCWTLPSHCRTSAGCC
jgi:hypothetical protein